MDTVRKLNISESYTPSSESYSNYLKPSWLFYVKQKQIFVGLFSIDTFMQVARIEAPTGLGGRSTCRSSRWVADRVADLAGHSFLGRSVGRHEECDGEPGEDVAEGNWPHV
jgi:hypothetical protein